MPGDGPGPSDINYIIIDNIFSYIYLTGRQVRANRWLYICDMDTYYLHMPPCRSLRHCDYRDDREKIKDMQVIGNILNTRLEASK